MTMERDLNTFGARSFAIAKPSGIMAAADEPYVMLKPVLKEGDPNLPTLILAGADLHNVSKVLEDSQIQKLIQELNVKSMEKDGQSQPVIAPGKATNTKLCRTWPRQQPAVVPKPLVQASSKPPTLISVDPLPEETPLIPFPEAVPKTLHSRCTQPVALMAVYDPTGLRSQVQELRLEARMLWHKIAQCLKLSQPEQRRTRVGEKFREKKHEERRQIEKLVKSNIKLMEEIKQIRMDRKKMVKKDQNRRAKRKKALERRQKRREWIMQQIQLGKMSKSDLSLVNSTKKLPYQKKKRPMRGDNAGAGSEAHLGVMSDLTGQKKGPSHFVIQTVHDARVHHSQSLLVGNGDETHVAVSRIPGVLISASDPQDIDLIVQSVEESQRTYTQDQF